MDTRIYTRVFNLLAAAALLGGTAMAHHAFAKGPNGLEHQGWKRDSMKIGDKVVVKGYQARNGSHTADGRRATLADGRRIWFGPDF